MKNFNGTIGNRTRDLPACSAVPQPTVTPRTPYSTTDMNEFYRDVQQLYRMVLSLGSSATLTARPRSCCENNHILRIITMNIQ